MATLSDSSKVMLIVGVFCLSLSSASATTPCKKWPLLANYNITSKEFTCSGAISAFRLCSFHAYTHIGLTVWRRGKGTLGRRVEYANGGFDILHRDLTYERGDQLDYMVSYYYAENHNEGIGCHIPVVLTTTYGYNCTDRMPKLYLKVTEDCFHDITETDTREENRTRLNGESTNSSSTNTSSTSSDSMNTTTISSRNATKTTTSATTSTPTLQGSTSATVSSENTSEATTTATDLTPTTAGTASYTKPSPAVKPEENSTTAANNNFTAQPQNSSSACPNEMAVGVSKVTQVLYGSSGSTIFTAMLTVIIIMLVLIVLETVVCILVCIICWRRGRGVREGNDDSNKPLKIGYKRTEEYDVALLEMDNPAESN